MYKIESNMESVLLNLRKSIVQADSNMEENLRRAGREAVAIVADRVQQKGEGAEGRLATKARLRMGAYSKQYAKRREARGRQIDHIDGTMDGDLFREWDVLSSSPTEAVVGFRSPEQAQIATYLEEQLGQPIFNLSDSEQDFVAEGLNDRFLDDLRN